MVLSTTIYLSISYIYIYIQFSISFFLCVNRLMSIKTSGNTSRFRLAVRVVAWPRRNDAWR